MKKSVVITVSFILTLFFINFVLAESISEDLHLNIQTTNSTGGIVTGTFAFVFNISTTSDCLNIIYTNSTSLTTDSRGIISYYLPSVSLNYSEQYYLCYYRNSVLMDSTKIVRSPYSFRARNITMSGIEPDSNLNMGSYNMTARYYFGNGTYLTDVNDTLRQLNCANEQVIKWNVTSNLWYCSDVSAPGSGDIDAVNTDNIYLTGGQTSGTVNLVFNETKLNLTIDYRISTNNASIVNWVTSLFVQISNIVNLVGNWSADKVNYYNTTQIVEINTSMKNYVDFQNTSQTNYINWNNVSVTNAINAVASAGEPLWTGNVSIFNSSWLNTYNATTNDSITNFIVSNNVSVNNYINATNISMKNYVDFVGDRWDSNYTNMQNPCSPNFVTGIYQNGTFICGTVEQASETDPYWTANYTAFNASWSYTFNQTTNDSIKNYISSNNQSLVNWINSAFVTISNIVNLVGNWSADKVNYYNTTQIVEINTSMKNYVDWVNTTNTGGSDANWNANFTAFNDSWSYTFNQTTNDSITNFIVSNNVSVNNYINATNISMKNYVDSTFLTEANESNLNVNNSEYLDGYDSTFFMPLNNSVYGPFHFNGGWLSNGLSIINGNLYAQAGYFYNITGLDVNTLKINGSLLPATTFDGVFDIGSPSLRWKDLYLSGQMNSATANITGTLYVAGVNISKNNESMKNYVDFQNTSQTNYIDFVGARWDTNYSNMQTNCGSDFVTGIYENGTFICGTVEAASEADPYWAANYSAFNSSWSYTFNQTTNDSINNYILANNGSLVNYIGVVNTSMKNYVDFQNTSQTNYINFNNISVTNAINAVAGAGEPLWSANYTAFNNSWSNMTNGSYVPYTGANQNVNLGNNNLIVNGTTLFVDATTGRVGIGTTSPDKLLTVVGVIKSGGTGTSGRLELARSTDGASNFNLFSSGAAEFSLQQTGGAGSLIVMGANGIEFRTEDATSPYTKVTRLIVKHGDNANVGIGTINPFQKLHVNGSILANGTINATTDVCIQGGNCLSNITGIAGEPLWTGNVSIFNSSWLSTYNATTNDSIKNYILSNNDSIVNYITVQNTSLVNYIGVVNTSMKNYVDFQNTSQTNYINWNNVSVTNAINAVASAGEPLWTGNVSIFNSSWLNTYNATTNDSITNFIVSNNVSVNNYINGTNISMKNYVDFQNTSQTNYIDFVGSRWNSNYTNMQNPCSPNFVTGIYENGTFICGTVEAASEADPYWAANYSAFNSSWSYTFNQTTNDSINNYISSNNQSLVNWINSAFVTISNLVNLVGNWSADKVNYYNTTQIVEINTSMKNYVDWVNTTNTGGSDVNWNANFTAFNDSWSYTFNQTTNDSITNFIVSNNVSVNNYINTTNISMKNYVDFQNTSQTNYINWNNVSVTNAINAVASAGEPLWSANYTAFNSTWSYTFNQTTNNSITNSITANNASMNNYIINANNTLISILNNGSYFNTAYTDTFVANYSIFLTHIDWSKINNGTIWSWVMNGSVLKASDWNATNTSYMTGENFTLQNTSMKNYVDAQNTSQTNYINWNNVSVTNAINAVASAGEPLWSANYTAFNASWSSTTNTSYVPYVGANQNVNLGANNLSVNTNTLFVDKDNGRVGIGTTAPTAKFQIGGTFTAPGTGDASIFRVNTNITALANGDLYSFKFDPTFTKASSGTHAYFLGVNIQAPVITGGAATVTTAASLFVAGAPTGATNNYAIYADGTSVLAATTGNVGIGTTNPFQKLHVNGSILANGTINATTDVCIQGGNCLSNVTAGLGTGTINGSGIAWYIPMWNGTTSLNNSAIYQNGSNIGIGTTTPQNTLNVVGTINVTNSNVKMYMEGGALVVAG